MHAWANRYVISVFQQRAKLDRIGTPASRSNFNTRAYAAGLGLTLVGATYFTSHKGEDGRRRTQATGAGEAL